MQNGGIGAHVHWVTWCAIDFHRCHSESVTVVAALSAKLQIESGARALYVPCYAAQTAPEHLVDDYWVRHPFHLARLVGDLVADYHHSSGAIYCHAVALMRYGLPQTLAAMIVASACHEHARATVVER